MAVRSQAEVFESEQCARAQMLYEEALRARHLAKVHKRQARRKMIEFDTFRRQLESIGVKVIIEAPIQQHHPSPQRRTSDGSGRDTAG